jgi:hypothetical protein
MENSLGRKGREGGSGGWLGVFLNWKKSNFSSSIFMKVRFSSLNSKTGQTTSLNFSNRAFLPPWSGFKGGLLQ